MKIEIQIDNPASNRRTLKTWVELPDYNEDSIDQFEYLKVYQLDSDGQYIGDMSANNVGPTLNHSDMQKIAALQIEDEYSIDAKMEWCTFGGQDRWGGVMRIPGGGNWSTAPVVRMVGCVWAGNIVEVLEQRTFHNVLYNSVRGDVNMSRIRTFNPLTDWGKTFATDPHIIHSVMAVGRDDIEHKPKGNIYLPLLFRYPSVWIFDNLLK